MEQAGCLWHETTKEFFFSFFNSVKVYLQEKNNLIFKVGLTPECKG